MLKKDICWPIWILGLLGYLILAWWAIRISTSGTESIPNKLDLAAQAALDRAGISWATASLDGQAAIVGGSAPSALERDRALTAVKQAIGKGGVWRGGVTKVRDRTTLSGGSVAALTWFARRLPDGGVELSGSAPSMMLRGELIDMAKRLFKGRVIDSMSDSKLGSQSGAWLVPAKSGLELLARLSDGEAELNGNRLTVRGTAPNSATVDASLVALRGLPEPFKGESGIVTQVAIPELSGMDLNINRSSIADCQAAFGQITSKNTVNFSSGLATLTGDNRATLSKIAHVAKTCSRYQFIVEGHTDASGSRTKNIELSNARAETVRAYLIDQGVSPERLSTIGYGPDRPIASNTNKADMARNRRIEFAVRPDGDQ